MIPSIERAHTFVLKAFDRVKRGVFHVLVEVRVREGVGGSVSRLVGKLKEKKRGARGEGRERKIEAMVIAEGVDAVSSTPSQPEQATDSSQKGLIPTSAEEVPLTTHPLPLTDSLPPEEPDPFPPITRKNFYKHPIFWARFLGYAIPLSFLLYVLYLNYLPFGYHKTFTINVGSQDDTEISEFYLEPSKDLSERKMTKDGVAYRELNGITTAVFKSNAILRDAEITIEAIGEKGINLIPPQINFDPNSIDWDHDWDFRKVTPKDFININNRAFNLNNGTYFDGMARLEMASSSEILEEGPIMIYVEWMPTNQTNGDNQQIIGHYNWELWQNNNNISFQVGRMNNAEGPVYKIKYPIDKTFFNTKHTAVAVYKPEKNGYIELFIDGNYAGRTYFDTDKIWKDYGKNNLSLGWTPGNYGGSPYFKGYIYKACIAKNILPIQSKITFSSKLLDEMNITIITSTSTIIKKIKLDAKQQ